MSELPTSLTPIEWEPPTDEPDLHCDVCGRSDFKTSGGLKRHKTTAHGERSTEKISVARQIQRDTGGRGAPSVEQLSVATGRLVGYGTIFIASKIVDSDPRPMSDEQRDIIVDSLSATPDESKELMRPLARIFAGTKLNKRVGRKIVDNIDAADSLMAFYAMSRRWQQYMDGLKEYKKVNGTTKKPLKTGMKDPYTPVMASGERVLDGVAPMDDRKGVVVDADMVRKMQAGAA